MIDKRGDILILLFDLVGYCIFWVVWSMIVLVVKITTARNFLCQHISELAF